MVVIKAFGMASSLGPAVPACAAFRAGLSRPSPAPDFDLAILGDEGPRSATIFSLPVATFGFSGVGRLVALTCEVLKDLWSRADLTALAQEAGFFFALPDPRARGLEPAGADATDAQQLEALGARVLAQSFQNLGLGWKGPLRFFGGGHVAFTHAMHAAQAQLSRRAIKSCVVAAVDSLVEEGTLQALEEELRLKTAENPVGIIPGEAGAAFLLSTTSARPPQEPDIQFRAVCLGREPNPRGSDKPADGRALARCILDTLSAGGDHQQPLLISDHNGEQHRAMEWGLVQMHLRSQIPTWEDLKAWYPAVGFGDVGCASSAVGLCLAIRSLQRRYAPEAACLILSSSDEGARAAMLIGSTHTKNRRQREVSHEA